MSTPSKTLRDIYSGGALTPDWGYPAGRGEGFKIAKAEFQGAQSVPKLPPRFERATDRANRITVHASYLRQALQEPEQTAATARLLLEDIDYDTMVGQGLSGALVIPTLARSLGKFWMIVRKPDDKTHSDYKAEGTLGRRWIFVDDLIQSGATRLRVQEAVKKQAFDWRFETEYVGAYLYHTGHFRDPRH